MATKSAFSIVGLAHKVCLAAEEQGYNPELLNALAEDPTLFSKLLKVQLGCAEIKMTHLLIPLGTAMVAATVTSFVARDRFFVNTQKSAPVKISYLGGNFEKWFLGKVEQPFGGSTLKYGKLSRYSVDDPIIKELGGEEKAETTLAEFFYLMERQPNGESGTLLTNGYGNILYVRDVSDVLRAVRACWFDGGWSVDAYPVTHPYGWDAGRQVFSRNSR